MSATDAKKEGCVEGIRGGSPCLSTPRRSSPKYARHLACARLQGSTACLWEHMCVYRCGCMPGTPPPVCLRRVPIAKRRSSVRRGENAKRRGREERRLMGGFSFAPCASAPLTHTPSRLYSRRPPPCICVCLCFPAPAVLLCVPLSPPSPFCWLVFSSSPHVVVLV